MERFAPDAPAPETATPVERMAYRLGTQTGRALYGLCKQTVKPVFGIIKRVVDWRQIGGLRNVLGYQYLGVDLELV